MAINRVFRRAAVAKPQYAAPTWALPPGHRENPSPERHDLTQDTSWRCARTVPDSRRSILTPQ